jgi:hypothetical protein
MQARAYKYFLYGQILLYFGVLISILIHPKGLSTDDGLSYYGIYLKTIIPYGMALLASAVYIWKTADKLSDIRWLSYSFKICSILIVGIALTPYSVDPVLNWAHEILGSLLFILQLTITGKLAFFMFRCWQTISLWIIEFLGGVFSAVYVTSPTGYLLQSQLVFQLAFGLLILYVLKNKKLLKSTK